MTRERFIAGLERLGHNISTGHRLLGIGRATMYRISRGTSEVPPVVQRLMDMYEKFGVPEEHRQ
jgi:hypothetical protein